MTDIVVLGTGLVAAGLAAKLAGAGHSVAIGSRDPKAAADRWQGPRLPLLSAKDAVRGAAIVINATPGDSSVAYFGTLRDAIAGKILIDVANATAKTASGAPGGLCYPGSSLGEKLQELLPETKVVKTLNTMFFSVMTAPASLSGVIAFLSGNDADAKAQVRGLLGDMGWPREQILDAGGISSAQGTEAFLLLVPGMIQAYGFTPFALSVAR